MAAPDATPAKRTISSVSSHALQAKSDIDLFLKDELGKSTASVSADTFLHFPSLQGLWRSGDWNKMVERLTNDETQMQLRRVWGGITNETDQYQPFCDWVRYLLRSITELPLEPTRKIRFVDSHNKKLRCGRGYLNGKEVEGTATSFQPDMVCMADGVTELTKWSQVLVPIEFKKGTSSSTATASGNVTPALPISGSPTPTTRESAAPRASGSQHLAPPQTPTKSKSKEDPKPANGGGNGKSVKQGKRAEGQTTHRTHRFRSVGSSPEPPQKYTPTAEDIQLARYAMETLAAVGDRTHVFALFVKHPDVKLWYFDRCGAVCTSALNIDDTDDVLVFLKFLSSLVYMKDDIFGFNPFFSNPSPTASTGTRETLLGRTLSIPDSNNATLKLQDVLDRRTGLVGRATLVCKATLRKGRGKGKQVVIKSSWQHSVRVPESDILNQLHKDKEAAEHIVLCFHGWEGATVSAQRARFGEPAPSVVDDRALRHTVLEYLDPITDLAQPFHIPSIGWNIMNAIKFLNEKKWFHRDISIGNMGFTLHPVCLGAVIKLHDFDLSKHHASSSGTSHWTGTVPFMSIELLSQEDAPHMIGFEVEALTWTILWIVLVYTNGVPKDPLSDHPLKGWFANNKTLKDIAGTKAMHLTMATGLTNDFYKDLNRELRGLVKEWRQIREKQVDERDKHSCDTLISEHVYGMPCFDTIQKWMKEQRWDEPRKPCTCGKHCLLE